MIYNAIDKALQAYIATKIVEPLRLVVQWDNTLILDSQGQPYKEDPWQRTEPWITVSVTPLDDLGADFGAPRRMVRYTGVIMIRVLTPLNGGTADSRELADHICKVLSLQDIDPVTTQVAKIVNRAAVNGWWQTNINCSWTANALTN